MVAPSLRSNGGNRGLGGGTESGRPETAASPSGGGPVGCCGVEPPTGASSRERERRHFDSTSVLLVMPRRVSPCPDRLRPSGTCGARALLTRGGPGGCDASGGAADHALVVIHRRG